MKYPEDFKKRVEKEFPGGVDVHKALLIRGDYNFLRDLLYKEASKKISTEDIVELIQSGHLQKLLESAMKIERINKLYEELLKIHENQKK